MLFEPVDLTDSNEIESIKEYLKGLNPSKASVNDTASGMAYLIEILFEDGTQTRVALTGTRIRLNGNAAHPITYDEAAVFNKVIGSILINRYRGEHAGTIVRGEVVSVSSSTSGATISCELNHHRLEGGGFRCCGWKPPKAP